MKLQWSDEFEMCPNGRPDPTTWEYEKGYVRNNELQFYREDDARCDDGQLVITATKHPGDGIDHPLKQRVDADERCHTVIGGKRPSYCRFSDLKLPITSSSLQSKQASTGLLLHGQYDARIRIPLAANSWPAWWAAGSRSGALGMWPQDGEVDIMEYRAGNMFSAVVFGTSTEDHDAHDAGWLPADHADGLTTKLGLNEWWFGQFHDYSFVWSESSMDVFIDGQHVQHIAISDLDERARPHNPYKVPPPSGLPLLMKLNLAVPPLNQWEEMGTGLRTPVQWPLKMEVEYIRYFVPGPGPPPPLPPRYLS